MRVLIVTAEYPPAPSGGIGVFYRELAQALGELGAAVCLLAADSTIGLETRRTEQGVDVCRIPWAAGRSFAGPLRRARALGAAARRLARELQPDIVETHDWAAPLWVPPTRPFVVRLHGASTLLAAGRGRRPSRLLRLLEKRMLSQADALVAVSQWVRGRSAEVFEIPSEPMRVIPNGVDIEYFRPGGAPRLGEVVFAGTLREDKGVVELLQALEIVFHARPDATATFAGGPERWHALDPRIRRQVERLQLAAPQRLQLLGPVDRERLAALYRRAGVCVFPSHVEAFGLACVEAMSCGAPVVASRAAAGAEIVEEGRSGLLVDPREPAEIAAAILRCLSRPDLAQTYGEQARRRVVQHYTMRQTAERTLELYAELQGAKALWPKRSAA